jgi:hypothetical protein
MQTDFQDWFLVLPSDDEVVEIDQNWMLSHRGSRLCQNCNGVLDHEWIKNQPLIVNEFLRGSIATNGLTLCVSNEFMSFVQKHVSAAHRLQLQRLGGEACIRSCAVYVGDVDRVFCYRGRLCRHRQCGVCHRVINKNWRAFPALVRGYLENKCVVFARETTDIFLSRSAVSELCSIVNPLSIKFVPVPLLDCPADNQTLPVDPEWRGVLKTSPIPILPDERLVKGTGMYV